MLRPRVPPRVRPTRAQASQGPLDDACLSFTVGADPSVETPTSYTIALFGSMREN